MAESDWEVALTGGDPIKMIEAEILRHRMDIYELRLANLHSREKLIDMLEREIDELIEVMKTRSSEEMSNLRRQMIDAGGGIRNFPAGLRARNLEEDIK
jgi:hypothetical protein